MSEQERAAVYAAAELQRSQTYESADIERERAVVDARSAYEQQKASYGANAEALSRMGLTGSGYSDMVDQRAYAQQRAETQAANAQAAGVKRSADYAEHQTKLNADSKHAQNKYNAQSQYNQQMYDIDTSYRQNMLDADLALMESQKAAQDAERASKAAADEEYRANQYAAEEQYRRDMYEVDSSYASNMAQAEAERKDRDYAAQSAEREAKAAADESYLKNMYATDAEYSSAKAKAEAEAREAKLKAEQTAAAGKLEAGLTYAENMLGSDYLSMDESTGNVFSPGQYIEQNGAALGNMDDVDAAYQNGSIDKSTYQAYYTANASALIKQAKTIDDAQAISDSLAKYVEEGKMTSSDAISKENELYRSISHIVGKDSYTVGFFGTSSATITLGKNSYDVDTDLVASNKIQTVLNKIHANASDGDLVGVDNKVYIYKNGRWRGVRDAYGDGFVDAYNKYNENAGGPGKVSTPSGDGKAEIR